MRKNATYYCLLLLICFCNTTNVFCQNIKANSFTIEKELIPLYKENWYPKDSLSYIDDIVTVLIKNNDTITVDKACVLIKTNFTTSLQKARAIFYWIASTVQYDFNLYLGNFDIPIFDYTLDAAYTFKYKTGLCENYCNLYRYMCQQVGLQCKLVAGWSKNFPFYKLNKVDHAWNCVNTDKGWILLDVTWARIDSTGLVDNYWFNTAPQEFIYNHFPRDSSLQFLQSKITLEQFSNYPTVSAFFFKSKMKWPIPEAGNIILPGNQFSISNAVIQKKYSVSYSILPYSEDLSELINLKWFDLKTKTIINKENGAVNYKTVIPKKGTWWLSVTINKRVLPRYYPMNTVSFPKTVIFKVTAK